MAANLAASRMEDKYAGLDDHTCLLALLLRILEFPAQQLFSNLAWRLVEISMESHETSFLFQRCSVLMERFSTVLLHNSLPAPDWTD